MKVFSHPSRIIISGPSQSGKTVLATKIIENQKELFEGKEIENIYFCYSSENSITDDLKKIKNIKFIQGFPELEIFKNNSLICLDDLMLDSVKDNRLERLFTVESHHRKLSVLFLIQNIFYGQKIIRTVTSNSNFLILFKTPRYSSQFSILSRQIFPENWRNLNKVFNTVTEIPFNYLCIDLTPNCNKFFQFKSDITNNYCEAYVTSCELEKLQEYEKVEESKIFFEYPRKTPK